LVIGNVEGWSDSIRTSIVTDTFLSVTSPSTLTGFSHIEDGCSMFLQNISIFHDFVFFLLCCSTVHLAHFVFIFAFIILFGVTAFICYLTVCITCYSIVYQFIFTILCFCFALYFAFLHPVFSVGKIKSNSMVMVQILHDLSQPLLCSSKM
jgi:hypothetical protein